MATANLREGKPMGLWVFVTWLIVDPFFIDFLSVSKRLGANQIEWYQGEKFSGFTIPRKNIL